MRQAGGKRAEGGDGTGGGEEGGREREYVVQCDQGSVDV